ncbi:hypothetical protein NECAME_01342 [Necator americanus]|uniref:Beta-N-acetylhexosaminidase n=1 Tax=Necator americanus TaxID=51031 RepID=W2TX09_NECAM|nr:hypothetical protein NECAME_01342 [Necator americanus]ETN86214.1 hypothetical protein NECAME_01342 [Necator americanus]
MERQVPKRIGGPHDQRPFAQAIVHLDLKGAPPLMSVYEWFFPLLRKLNVHGVLMEYEDMFPYTESLAQIKRSDHYTEEDIARINQLATDNSLELIPLVQTFGHMEFILKHSTFVDLRENITAVSSLIALSSFFLFNFYVDFQ